MALRREAAELLQEAFTSVERWVQEASEDKGKATPPDWCVGTVHVPNRPFECRISAQL